MKNGVLCRFVLLTTLSCVFVIAAQAEEKDKSALPEKQVLMLGLTDNVRSNYFPKIMITEETGIMEDVIDKEYNAIIMDNIVASAHGACKFIPVSVDTPVCQWANMITVNGEGDESFSDVSSVPDDEYRNTLNTVGADYLLVLNQHYLKWQETPMRTLFHIVSYTLFDKDKNEVYRGNGYFTCMNLERPDKLRKISSKTSSRIASAIISRIK